MTNSAISAVDAFKAHTTLLFKFLFGLKICPRCPFCTCTDAEGRSNEIEGGIAGRMCTVTGSYEFQKKRDEHIHMQCCIECPHSFCTLAEIADLIERTSHIVDRYKSFADGLCNQGYFASTVSPSAQYEEAEKTWPEHRDQRRLPAPPSYLAYQDEVLLRDATHGSLLREGQRWVQNYREDLDRVTRYRQEHIHPKNASGEARPLTACQQKDKPNECKHGFFKTHLVSTIPRVICEGLAKKLEMPWKGKRNVVGTIEPSRSSGSVNGAIPALLVGAGDNNDVKLPIRLPITSQTHDVTCKASCIHTTSWEAVIDAAEASQAAQVGYHCDYSTKRHPCGVRECKEWSKGHVNLENQMRGEPLSVQARKHTKRIISDCFCRGILRVPNETSKLNDKVLDPEPTAAEMLVLAPYKTFAGGAYLAMVEGRTSVDPQRFERGLLQILEVKPGKETPDEASRSVLVKKPAHLYGYRGHHSELVYLSPYEFERWWEIRSVNAKLLDGQRLIKFPMRPATQTLAEHWGMVKRERPTMPVFHSCPMPVHRKDAVERNSRLLLAYFHPWVIADEDAIPHVPTLATLAPGEQTNKRRWTEACTTWLSGRVLTMEMKYVIQNFFAVTRSRPQDKEVERTQSDEDISDADLDINAHDLEELLMTIPGGRRATKGRKADEHHENAVAALAHVRQRWHLSVAVSGKQSLSSIPLSLLCTKAALAGANAMRRTGEQNRSVHSYMSAKTAGQVEMRPVIDQATIESWLKKNVDCTGVSSEQGAFVREVALRVFEEKCQEGRAACTSTEPLRKLVHGKPGTGKSSKCMGLVMQFFNEVCDYQKGVHYHVCTLQAFLAAALGGDTMHHLAGINPFFSKAAEDDDTGGCKESTQTRLLLARWLLVDEIFMASAQFWAEFECAIRNSVSATSSFRSSPIGIRPFGGLNVLGFGDAYQLDCPEGTPLYKIPAALLPETVTKEDTPLVARGLALLWDREGGQGFQGVLDLTVPFRCTDLWWNSVLDEFRFLRLTSDTHSFLHGRATSVPGSWLGDAATCGNPACQKLPNVWKGMPHQWDTKQAMECKICQQDRVSRCRVNLATVGVGDDANWEFAPRAVPNNDLRYELNKLQARRFARKHKVQLLWVPAIDRVGVEALRTDPSLPGKKMQWLGRHDRQCGDLHGMLPLALGMPLVLMKHLDRSEAVQMLKGTRVAVHSIHLHPDDEREARGKEEYVLRHALECLYVEKQNSQWQVCPNAPKGVYPIKPATATWYLDKGRAHPQLAIHRRQLAVSPAFAVTIFSLQGGETQELEVDVNISSKCSPQTCYVALSRTKSREGIRIMRPFPISAFQGTSPVGPALLLATLRQDEAQVKHLVEAQQELQRHARAGRIRNCQLPCAQCHDLVSSLEYSHRQLDEGEDRLCPSCVIQKQQKQQEGDRETHAILPCSGSACRGVSYPREAFSHMQLHKGEARLCKTCVQKKEQQHVEADREAHATLRCSGSDCRGLSYPREDFCQRQLDKGEGRLCKTCVQKKEQQNVEADREAHAILPCSGSDCRGLSYPREDFSHMQLDKGEARLCKTCVQKKEQQNVEADREAHAILRCAGSDCRGLSYPRQDFSQRQLDKGEARLCKTCVQKKEQQKWRLIERPMQYCVVLGATVMVSATHVKTSPERNWTKARRGYVTAVSQRECSRHTRCRMRRAL